MQKTTQKLLAELVLLKVAKFKESPILCEPADSKEK
jgi:hypothetical protein